MAIAANSSAQRPLRILRVLTRPNLGGPTRQAIALWHAHRELGIIVVTVLGDVQQRFVQRSRTPLEDKLRKYKAPLYLRSSGPGAGRVAGGLGATRALEIP